MNFHANDSPTLVAPRPVRLNSGQHAIFTRSYHDRVRVTDSNGLDDFKVALFSDSSSDKDTASPRSSPRSGLPTEALEEFLSILRPSFFPPTSPILRTRRQAAATFQHERSFSYKGRGRLEIAPQKCDSIEELNSARSTQLSRNTCTGTPDSPSDFDGPIELENDSPPLRWFKANILSSPISRTHTRNPFLRHPSSYSSGTISPLSPAAIPLPLPTPDEMADMS